MAEPTFTSDLDFGPGEQVEEPKFTTEKDFGQPTNQPSLNIAQTLGPGKSFLTGAGYGLTKAGRGLEEAWLRWFGSDKEREDLQKVIANEERIRKEIGSGWNPNAGYITGGEITGQVLPALAIPTPQSKAQLANSLLANSRLKYVIPKAETTLGRAGWNALIGGGYEGLTSTGSFGDRATAAGLGSIGGAGGSIVGDLITKGWNRLRGVYDQPEAIALAERLRKLGLKPRLGDIMDPGTGTLVRSGENLLAETPIGSSRMTDDIETLRRMIVPDRIQGTNIVSEAVKQTEKGVQNRADEIWQPFKEFVTTNQVPGVRPVNLYNGLKQITRFDKGFLNDIKDDVLRKKLEDLLTQNPNKLKAIPADEYVELNSALSGLTPYIKARAQPAPGSTALADKQSYKRFAENIMDGLRKDWDTWKTYKSPNAKQAKELLDTAQTSWKKEVLPWQRSELVYKLKDIEQHGSPETARLISGEPDIDLTSLVRDYLKRYGPYDSEVPVEALMAMNRQGQALASGAEKVSGMDISRGLFGAPVAAFSRKPGFQKYYLGSAQPQGPLMELIKRGIIGTGRETGLEQLVGTSALQSLIGKKDDGLYAGGPEDIHGVGHATQIGVR